MRSIFSSFSHITKYWNSNRIKPFVENVCALQLALLSSTINEKKINTANKYSSNMWLWKKKKKILRIYPRNTQHTSFS